VEDDDDDDNETIESSFATAIKYSGNKSITPFSSKKRKQSMDIGLNAPLERRHSLPLPPATQLEIVKCDLRLRGIRIRQLAACNTKTV
jgi:hypothetical protein